MNWNSVLRCLQVNLVSKRCDEPGCNTLASFGFPGGERQFCLEHKSADMVWYQDTCLLTPFVLAALCDQQCMHDGVYCNSVLKCLQVNVHAKPCQEPGCTKQPSFGFSGGKAQFCLKHKVAGMVCHPGVCTVASICTSGVV